MAYVLAVASALANAVTTILQRMGVETAPAESRLKMSLITYAVHKRVWVAGIALMVASFFLQATALGFGRLTIVQPIVTLELPFLVAILAIWFGHRLRWREWTGALGAAGGLAAFFAIASPQGGDEVPGVRAWGTAGMIGVVAVAGATALARVGPAGFRSAMFGTAAAVCYAFTAAFTKEVTEQLRHHWYAPVLHWEFYAMAVGGLLGVFLTQNAFHAGPVTASQSTLTIVDPLVSIGLGVGLFGDQLQTGATRIMGEGLALAVLFGCVLILASSPLVANVRSEQKDAPYLLADQRRRVLDRQRHRDDSGPVRDTTAGWAREEANGV